MLKGKACVPLPNGPVVLRVRAMCQGSAPISDSSEDSLEIVSQLTEEFHLKNCLGVDVLFVLIDACSIVILDHCYIRMLYLSFNYCFSLCFSYIAVIHFDLAAIQR